jgi:hypothetical protein
MNSAGALGALSALVGLIAFVASLAFMFIVFLLLIFINSNTKDIRHYVISMNEHLAALRKIATSNQVGVTAEQPPQTPSNRNLV